VATLRLRDARRADGRALRALSRLALAGSGGAVHDPRWDRDLLDVEAAYAAPGGAFLAGTVRGRIVAMGGLRRVDARTCEVVRMRVVTGARRRGYGRRVLAALTERATAAGAARLVLETTAAQRPARALYERAGFRVARRRRRRVGDEVFDVVEYAKDLAREGEETTDAR
jgi:ribosomal protein S18 acetylase RimI-like enzyme